MSIRIWLACLLAVSLCFTGISAFAEAPDITGDVAEEAALEPAPVSDPAAGDDPAEVPLETPQEEREILFLPSGIWILTGYNTWTFQVGHAISLTAEQRDTAELAGIMLEAGNVREGAILTIEQLYALYPGAEALLAPPLMYPVRQQPMAEAGVTVPASEKIFYLTIDDTPSETTPEMLALLDSLGIKATFFIVGGRARQYPEYVRAIYDAGHVIANHSYSHDAKILSSSASACLADFRKCEKAVADALGFPLEMPILRIPYGASTVPVSYRTKLQENGYMWIDWNALNGDTESTIKSDKAALERAYSTAVRYDGAVVMLVHDGKDRTLRTMEEMIAHFSEKGYTFGVLQTNIERIPGARMGFPK